MPNYSDKTVETYRPQFITEAQIHDKLAMHGLSLDERNEWWKERLPELGGYSPAYSFSSDPLMVKFCAEMGAIGVRPRKSLLTPSNLWGDAEDWYPALGLRVYKPSAPQDVEPEVSRSSLGKGQIFDEQIYNEDAAPVETVVQPPPPPAVHKKKSKKKVEEVVKDGEVPNWWA